VRVGVSRGQRTNPSAPESAVSVQGDAAFVYVLHTSGQGTMVEQRPIVTGARQQGFVEIVNGVKPGDRVVGDGLNKIQPGQPVRVGGSGARREGAPGPVRPEIKTSGPAAGARPSGPRPAA
jgi:membrane fusion protein (multidrug efflux system)